MRRGSAAVAAWIDDRLGAVTMLRRLTSGVVARHGAWLRTTGFACLVLVLIEAVTGPVLLVYYGPSPGTAYSDVLRIEQDPLGRFVRGVHHWASAALIVLGAVTIARMFFLGDYKAGRARRRDVVWIGAILLTLFTLLFQLTGHILPWDTNAVGTAAVEAGIASNVWGVGPLVKRFILGEASPGAVTLARWCGFHVGVLPVAFALVVALPLFLARLRAADQDSATVPGDSVTETTAGAASAPGSTRVDRYYPTHLAREMAVALTVVLIVAALALFTRTPLQKEATAANLEGYTAVSEWYVMPLHALTILPPFNNVKIEPIATVVLPGLLFAALVLLPFYDRDPVRPPFRRPALAAAGVLTILATLGLSAYSLATERSAAPAPKPGSGAQAAPSATGTGGQLVSRGLALYKAQGCDGCHAIAGTGGKVGPDLTHEAAAHADATWQIEHLKNPSSKVPGSTMPAYKQLKPAELQALADYLVSLK